MSEPKIYVKPGEWGISRLPFSEVCMHLGIAGKTFLWKFQGESVQLYEETEPNSVRPFSIPILPSEAGLFRDSEKGWFYRLPQGKDLTREEAEKEQNLLIWELREIFKGAMVFDDLGLN